MKTFSDFIKESSNEKKPPILITAQPVHGGHSRKMEPILITAQPVHGGHASTKKKRKHIKEEVTETDAWQEHNENEHLGKNLSRVSDKINMSPEDFQKHPGSQHVRGYTVHSASLNNILIKKATGQKSKIDPEPDDTAWLKDRRQSDKETHEKSVKAIDNALTHSKLPHDLHVYHGTTTFNPGEEANKHPEGHIKIPTYLSTSISKTEASAFADPSSENGHIIHIHMKKGQNALPIGGNSDHSGEEEVLLPRNQTLKVHPVPTKLDNGMHVWHAHVVDQPN